MRKFRKSPSVLRTRRAGFNLASVLALTDEGLARLAMPPPRSRS
jgi:hypothetical protein